MYLLYPFWLLVLLLLPVPWIVARRKGHLGFSNLDLLARTSSGRLWQLLPLLLIIAGLVSLTIALARPQSAHIITDNTFKSRDTIISVDISGSMAAPYGKVPPSIVGETDLDREYPGRPQTKQNQNYYYGGKVGERRIDSAQAAVLDFIRDRYRANANDRVGLNVFDTDQYWSWPLTNDLKMIYRKVHFADTGLGGGTNFGDMKPGPIDAAAEHFDEMGKAATRLLIMVTDGEDRLGYDTFARLEKLTSDYKIRLYVIGVGDSMDGADILRLAEATGGKAFNARKPEELRDCFSTIDRMEQSLVTVETTENREELFHYFACAALLLLLCGSLAEALVVNR